MWRLLRRSFDALQRGRAQSSAESQELEADNVRLAIGFNGAALNRARREGVASPTDTQIYKLQRGRAQSSAERCGAQGLFPVLLGLQRGRAQSSAESFSLIAKLGLDGTLQRGRAQSSAESDGHLSPEVDHPVASTGPRSIERGEFVLGGGFDPRLGASTGPRSIERGEDTHLPQRYGIR